MSFSQSPSTSSSSPPRRHIEHYVTKLDTLAGVAIKYGVEVADIKKMNGLVSDLQMFARKTLLIPLPGRHPPSLSIDINTRQCNNDRVPPRRARSATFFDSFQSLSMSPEHRLCLKESEMATHQDNNLACRRCKSMANISEIGEANKPQVVDNPRAPRGLFSTISGKNLALRKATSRNNLGYEGENSGGVNKVLTMLADSFVVVSSSSNVRKSSSTTSLQEQETNISSIWPDIQAALAIPIFDGLIKPIANQRVKIALD